mgnify:CR=1 FL=1
MKVDTRGERPTTREGAGRPTVPIVDTLRGCLHAIGYEDHERLSVLLKYPDAADPVGDRLTPAGLVELAADVEDRANLWHSPAVVCQGPGRGKATDVVRLPALFADLDVKPGGLPSWESADAVVEGLSGVLGSDPVYVTMSGHGLQPVWALDREDSTDVPRVTRALRRFGLLVRGVCRQHGGAADSVFDPVRVLRTPGSVNLKDPAAPVPTSVTMRGGRPLSLDEVEEALDAYAVPDVADDEAGPIVAPAGSWEWSDSTCAYVAAMVAGWVDEDDPDARHPFAVSAGVRLAVAHRSGCITEADHEAAVGVLTDRMRDLCKRPGAVRDFDPKEVADALTWGILKVEPKSAEVCHAELGDHHRDDPPPPDDVDDAATWPELYPLDEDTGPPPFPVHCLPPIMRDYVELVSTRVQVDDLIPSVMALGVLAALAQKTARVRGPGWSEQLSLFVLALADVSERKSPAHAAIVGPLYAVEARLDAAGADARALHNEERRILAAAVEAARKPRKGQPEPDAAAVAEMARELDAYGPEVGRPRLVADNVTLEPLKGLMAANGGRMAVVSPELSFLSILEGTYSPKVGADLSTVLSAYTGGEPLVVDRQTREGERIAHPALTVVAVGQPSRLRDLADVKGAEDRGLLARFIVARARPRAGTRTYSAAAAVALDPRDTVEGHAWADLLDRLADRVPLDDPPELRLDPDGLTRFVEWANAHEADSAPGGRLSLIPGFAGKAVGLLLRLAGLLWLAEDPDADGTEPIPDRVVEAAADLVDWCLVAHEDAMRGARIPEPIKRAVRLVESARRGTLSGSKAEPRPWAPFTVRHVSRQLSGSNTGTVDRDEARRLVELLTDHGYVAADPDAKGAYVWRPGLDAKADR